MVLSTFDCSCQISRQSIRLRCLHERWPALGLFVAQENMALAKRDAAEDGRGVATRTTEAKIVLREVVTVEGEDRSGRVSKARGSDDRRGAIGVQASRSEGFEALRLTKGRSRSHSQSFKARRRSEERILQQGRGGAAIAKSLEVAWLLQTLMVLAASDDDSSSSSCCLDGRWRGEPGHTGCRHSRASLPPHHPWPAASCNTSPPPIVLLCFLRQNCSPIRPVLASKLSLDKKERSESNHHSQNFLILFYSYWKLLRPTENAFLDERIPGTEKKVRPL